MCKITRHTKFAWLTGKSMNVGKLGAFALYEQGDYKVGDVVCFKDGCGKRYAHRVVLIEEFEGIFYLTMKGDNFEESMPNEKRVPRERIEGKIIWSIPKI